MLHEILLALCGHTGDVIRRYYSNDGKLIAFRVVDDFEYVSKSEREVINRLCLLGFYFTSIEDFIHSQMKRRQFPNRSLFSTQEQIQSLFPVESSAGLYVTALCKGLENILDGFRQTILDIEKEALQTTAASSLDTITEVPFPLSKVNYLLRHYAVVFPALYDLINDISRWERGQDNRPTRLCVISGGRLLQRLYRR
jgi:gamma-tubulin complex component 4